MRRDTTLATLDDLAAYEKARRESLAATTEAIATLGSDVMPLSRCGRISPLHAAERERIAELYVDLTQAPPLNKHEYILTEEELTAALSTVLTAQRTRLAVDCVKLHRNYVRLYATLRNDNGTSDQYAVGMSLTKGIGDLRIVIEDLSIGRASFQVEWLGLGIIGSRGSILTDAEGTERLAEVLDALNSRVFSVNVFEGYLRIVTWRLPSVIAARAAIDVGYVKQAVEQRVEPKARAASLGMIRPGGVLYVLERTDKWFYVCSEGSGSCGWIPRKAFKTLEDRPDRSTPS